MINSKVETPLLISVMCVLGVNVSVGVPTSCANDRPNIVFIMCDDLGYGDVHCLNPEHGKISTPGIDDLAKSGMTFTDAHSGSSVCTPTRYGLLTGRYSWRTRLQRGVVEGFQPCLIAEGRPTVASFLKTQGYHTAIIGKWHLNCQFTDPVSGENYLAKEHGSTGPVGSMIPDGPVHRGFDYFHGVHHARSMKAIIENDRVVEHDDEVHFLPRSTERCVEYIESRAGTGQPFFLYVPLGSPHTPIVPSPEWVGKSGLGAYGDFVMQTDNAVVEITRALAANGMSENTLVIFTSDNGCSRAAGIQQLAEKGHRVSAHLRGSKADIWDGGHRVPFIVRWPGKIPAGSNCEQLICLVDWFATVGDLLGISCPANSCEDSVSFLPAFFDTQIPSTRAGVIHHSVSGHFAIRNGDWKLILARASGGWSTPNEKNASKDAPRAQLYDMAADVGEQNNLYPERSDVADALLTQLKTDVFRGRSTDGPPSANDVPDATIRLWKSEEPKKVKDVKKVKKAGGPGER